MTPKRAQHLELTEIALKELTTPCALGDERTPLLTGHYRPASAPSPVPLRIIRHRGRALVIDWADWTHVVELRNSGAAPDTPLAAVVMRLRHADAVAAFRRSLARALAATPRQPTRVLADWLRADSELARELGVTVRALERGAGLSSGALAPRR